MDHSSLSGRMFHQGSVRYIVARQQEKPDYIRCYRKDGNVVTFEMLPIPFVFGAIGRTGDHRRRRSVGIRLLTMCRNGLPARLARAGSRDSGR